MTSDEAQARVDALQAQFDATLRAAGVSQDVWNAGYSSSDTGTSGVLATVVHNLQALQPRIEKWRTTYRKWAEAGQRLPDVGDGDGKPYSWERWNAFGSDLASELETDGGVAKDAIWTGAVAAELQPVAEAAQAVEDGAAQVADQAEELASEVKDEAGKLASAAGDAATHAAESALAGLKKLGVVVGGLLAAVLLGAYAVRRVLG